MENETDILITGGDGMLATAFKRLLPNAKFESRSTFDISSGQHRLKLVDMKPKVVINCAAYTNVDGAEKEPETADQINGTAVGALALTCRRIGATLVHFSSDYVFDGSLLRPLLPGDPVGPKSLYGRSKLIGEQLIVRDPPPRWLVIRSSWLYGPGGKNFPDTILAATRAGKPLEVIDDQIGAPTYANDLAVATLDLLSSNAKGFFHVANKGQTSWYDFAVETLKLAEVDVEISRISSERWRDMHPLTAVRPRYSVLDTSAYTTATGKTLRPWANALRDYIEHHQQVTT